MRKADFRRLTRPLNRYEWHKVFMAYGFFMFAGLMLAEGIDRARLGMLILLSVATFAVLSYLLWYRFAWHYSRVTNGRLIWYPSLAGVSWLYPAPAERNLWRQPMA